jgi:hypothetical protein
VDEARKLAACEHPSLVHVIDLDFHDGRPFVVMELVRGPNLEQYCKQTPPSFRATAHIVAELAEAVAYIHEQGIVHQDIKPKNVLIDGKGRARLIDFGLARASYAWSDELNQSVGGTAGYMSPEQASKGEQVPPRRINEQVPRRLERICLKALTPDANHRYHSAQELGVALRRYLRRSRMAAAQVAILGLAALAFVAYRSWPERWLPAGREPAPRTSVPAQPAPPPQPRIVSFEIQQFRDGEEFRALGSIGTSIRR